MRCRLTMVVCFLLASGPTALSAQDEDGVSDSISIRFEVGVTDVSGRLVTGLSREDFQIYEGTAVQEIQSFERIDIPFHILIINECTVSTGLLSGNIYYDRADRIPAISIPFQMAPFRLISRVSDLSRVAFVEFLGEPDLVFDWESSGGPEGALELRSRLAAPGQDCVITDEGPPGRFERKLTWILEELESISGRKSIVWFGPPKGLPGVLLEQDLPRLRREEDVIDLRSDEEHPDVQRIRDAVVRTGGSFFFVLANREFAESYPDDPERLRRRHTALDSWAKASGGMLTLVRLESQLDDLADYLNREPGTSYRLTYASSARSVDYRDMQIEVRVSDPAFRVYLSQPLSSD